MKRTLQALGVIAFGTPALTLLAWALGLSDSIEALAGGSAHPSELLVGLACVGLRIASVTLAPIAAIAGLLVWFAARFEAATAASTE